MKKTILSTILLITLSCVLPADLALAQNTPPAENVTKRRPDRPSGYTPSPSSSIQPAEVKQVSSSSNPWYRQLWERVVSFFR